MMRFGEYVRALREKQLLESKEFSVRKVAYKIGVEPAFLSKVERDIVPPPSEAKIIALKTLGSPQIVDIPETCKPRPPICCGVPKSLAFLRLLQYSS